MCGALNICSLVFHLASRATVFLTLECSPRQAGASGAPGGKKGKKKGKKKKQDAELLRNMFAGVSMRGALEDGYS